MNLHRSEISRRWAAILARLKETRHIIALSVFLILSMWYLFGAVNITIPTVISLLYIFKYQQAFRLRDVLRISLRMTVLCGAAIVCWVNLPLCILGNLAVPLGLVYSLSDRFTPKAYYIYVMEFVFLEMLPVSGSAILTRFFALFYGLLVFAAAFYCYARRAKRRRHYGTVRKGMKTLATQLENRALGTPDDGLAQTLATLCAHMSHVVYTSRNTRFLATGYGKINYLFLLFFQRMAYCLAHFFPAGQTLAPQDASYLRQLSCLLAALETKLDPPHSQQLLRRLQFLQDTCALSSPAGTEAMAEALALLVDALEEMAHTPMDQAMTHWPLLSEERKTLDGLFQFHRFQSRFAIRLAVVLCLSFTFVYLTQWPFAYWYPMTVFLMLMPYAEESAARINNRVLGNLLGLLMTALLPQSAGLCLSGGADDLPDVLRAAHLHVHVHLWHLLWHDPGHSSGGYPPGHRPSAGLCGHGGGDRLDRQPLPLSHHRTWPSAGQPPNPVGNRRPDAGGTAGNALLQQQPALLSPVSDSEQYAHPRNGDPPGGKPQYSGPHPPSPSAPPSA